MSKAGGVAGDHLKSFIERIERLEEEKKALAEDIRDVYSEAKANGFEVKIMRQIVKIRKMDKDELDEQEALLDTYLLALGMRGAREAAE
ncbi:MAG TPA: DUF2312 domain-containing protein [Stellaceae bacterium]|jgi:uncharacterized protein (UPF0335 family)|nr:DUF2312 domain-containing protein [Stellaceae bacterium]HWE75024.1 DUF2312 domain-containing protein [Stellaceae bacterium]